MKTALKPKQVESKKQHKRVLSQGKKSPGAGEAQEIDRIMDLWKEEVRDLASQKFASIEEGIEALVERVMLRFNARSDREMREFLIDTLSDDPEILSSLRAALRISG